MHQKNNEPSQTKVYTGRIVDVFHRQVRFVSGDMMEYEIAHRPLIAVVIPILPSRNFVMVCQYRAPIDKYILEFPGGTVEKDETPIEAAKRELEEETGYKANVIKLIGNFYTSPHFSDEIVYLFVATDLTFSKPHPQEKELISSRVLSEPEMKSKFMSAEIVDAKTIVAYQFFMQHKIILEDKL